MLDVFHSAMVHHSNIDNAHSYNNKTGSLIYRQTKRDTIIADKCEGCGGKIQDRFLMKIENCSWHEQCLTCASCGVLLNHSCYSKNNKNYCKPDYRRLFGVKCTRCGECILSQDMVMRAQSYIYHVACFMCFACCQPLQKGEQFILRNGQLFCSQDFEKETYLMQPSPESLMLDENCRPRDGRRGPKRPRTILTSVQRRQFKASFEISPKPCRKVREALAKDTGLSVRVVQVWFQNQRAKMKKIQRKAKQDMDKPADKNEKGNNMDSKQDSEHYLNANMHHDSDDTTYLSNHSGSHPLNPYSPDGTYIGDHSVESYCSSEVSLDSNMNIEENSTSDVLSLDLSVSSRMHDTPHSNNSQIVGQINPIDKLYLMQNSYFNTNGH